jgi:hypothetical protein
MNLESTAVGPVGTELAATDLVVIDELDRWTVPASALQAQTWICLRENHTS